MPKFTKREVRIVADLLEYNPEKTRVFEYTGIVKNNGATYFIGAATIVEVQHRIFEMQKQKNALPLIVRFWPTIDDYVQGKKPLYSGQMNVMKMNSLNLPYQPLFESYLDSYSFSKF